MTDVHPDLRSMTEAVEILSPSSYSILGEQRECPDGYAQPGHGSAEDVPPMVRMLEGEMYYRLYTRALPGGAPPGDVMAQRDHVRRLSMANCGTGTWEPGWRIVAPERDGRLAVAKENVTFYAAPSDVRTRSRGRGPGTFCRVRVGKEIRHLVPGFYMAVGNGDQRQRDELGRLVRIYWNLTDAVAVEYIARMTGLLNERNVPFRTKVVNDPRAYVRADGGVLYVERREFERVRPVVAEVREAIASGLRPEVPMLTKRLADGVGLAEDPGGGMSFGQARVHLVAKGLWSCFLEGSTSPEARLEAVVAQLAARGVDPARPYLDSGGRDEYELDQPAPTRAGHAP